MSLTLNQIIKRFEVLALSHHQIKHFYEGHISDFLGREEVTYAACFCEKLPGSISRTSKATTLNFRFWFLDLVNITDKDSNRVEVQSDMLSVAQDFKAMLESVIYQDDWTIGPGSSLTFWDETLEDYTGGVSVDVSIEIDYTSNMCQVPTTQNETNILKTDQGEFLLLSGNFYLKVS